MSLFDYLRLRLHTLFLTDVMSGRVTLEVIPEVVPEDREERVVVLPHDQAVLSLLVVGFPIRPVKPTNCLVLREGFKQINGFFFCFLRKKYFYLEYLS